MSKSKVYTLTGDQGTTSLVKGKRVGKDCVRVEAYGTIDELNAHIGQLTCSANFDYDPTLPQLIFKIQNKLFNLGAYLATESDDQTPIWGLKEDDVKEIEAKIDEMDAALPPFRGFVLPGGSPVSCICDVCRTVARRAERRIVALSREAYVDPLVLKYVNRLSDFFFIFARFNNVNNKIDEILWDKNV